VTTTTTTTTNGTFGFAKYSSGPAPLQTVKTHYRQHVLLANPTKKTCSGTQRSRKKRVAEKIRLLRRNDWIVDTHETTMSFISVSTGGLQVPVYHIAHVGSSM